MWRMVMPLIFASLPVLTSADPISVSLRPLPRPTVAIATSGTVLAEPAVEPKSVAPRVRPQTRPLAVSVTNAAPSITPALRPQPRPRDLMTRKAAPDAVTKAAVIAPPSRALTQSKKGSVCGDPSIRGETLAPITSRIKGCGVAEPVRITAIEGVRLSQAAIVDCTTAKALKKWIVKGLQPAVGNAKVVQLNIAAHYICRPRNNVKGARISEHGRGKAIDISAIVLADGRVLSVADDWGKTLRRVYKAACGIFGTTLGPGSDGYHEDHMHFDTARYRSGSVCR
jgi:hypothetical protein